MQTLRITAARKTFKGDKRTAVEALRNFNLEVAPGELLTIVGKSGCGKTTLLRVLAGLEKLDSGEVYLGSRRMDNLPPTEREVSMAFQQPALYPHMSVLENIAFPLRLRKMGRPEREARVAEMVDLMGLSSFMSGRIEALSGGEQQRVALARALVIHPHLLLLDEPLSNLDPQSRSRLRREIWKVQRQIGVTCIVVTHDQTEAMALGDRVAVMRDGAIEQCDSPRIVYAQPRSRFVAEFIGQPAMNIYDAEISGSSLRLGECVVPISNSPHPIHGKVQAAIRPEHVTLNPNPGAAELTGIVTSIEEIGPEAHVVCRGCKLEVTSRGQSSQFTVGQLVAMDFKPDRWQLFDRESGLRINGSI